MRPYGEVMRMKSGKIRTLVPLCGGLLLMLTFGCVSTGLREIRADRPETMSWIWGFELSPDTVKVRGDLTDSKGTRADELTVSPSESFRARGVHGTESWTLKEAGATAVFDVRGTYYGCTDPLAAIGIPSASSHWTVRVRNPRPDEVGKPALPLKWF
jgi:hypothetical protein